MKKIILPVLIIGLLSLAGCKGTSNELIGTIEGKVIANGEQFVMVPTNLEWNENDMEIKQLSSRRDIAELADDFETFESEKGDKLKFKIDKNPSSITVTKLDENGIIDSVEIKENEITLPTKEGYYIYELNVTWDEGKETFVFDVNVK